MRLDNLWHSSSLNIFSALKVFAKLFCGVEGGDEAIEKGKRQKRTEKCSKKRGEGDEMKMKKRE